MVIPLKETEKTHGVLGMALELTPAKKVRILKVHEGSPATKAGLKEGDIVTGIDGEEVTELFDITYALKLKKTGGSCRFSILRENNPLDINVELFSWEYH